MLIELLKKHKKLISGKFTQDFTFKDAEEQWRQIAEVLNSIPGAAKDWKNWRKVDICIYIYLYKLLSCYIMYLNSDKIGFDINVRYFLDLAGYALPHKE